MELKFLKEGTTVKEEDGIKIEFGQITSSVQSLLITMANVVTTPGRTALASYVIKNILTKLTIDGKEYDPHQVATTSDLSDPDTVATFFKISHLVMSGIILGMDIKKKLEEQPSPSGKEETAPSVRKAAKKAPRKRASKKAPSSGKETG